MKFVAALVSLCIVGLGYVAAQEVAVVPAPQQGQPRPPLPRSLSSDEVLNLLIQARIETRDFCNPMTLKDAIGLLADQTKLPIVVDRHAFKSEAPENLKDLYDTEVSLPSPPQMLPVTKALELLISRIEPKGGTFLIKDGYIEITTVEATRPQKLLEQKVLAHYQNRPLANVLHELSEKFSLSIIVSPDLNERPVTATFRNDIALRDALTILAEITGTQVEFLPSGVLFKAKKAK